MSKGTSRTPQQPSAGFTIVELMIATTVFSFVLLLCTFGLTRIGQTYYRGVTASRTQAAARTISDNIVQSIRFGGTSSTISTAGAVGSVQTTCVGRGRYVYIQGNAPVRDAANPSSSYLRYDEPAVCTPAAAVSNPRQLLPEGMRLSRFTVTAPVGNASAVTVKVTSGGLDLFESNNSVTGFCRGGAGSQFCAVSNLVTTASPRL